MEQEKAQTAQPEEVTIFDKIVKKIADGETKLAGERAVLNAARLGDTSDEAIAALCAVTVLGSTRMLSTLARILLLNAFRSSRLDQERV